MQLDDTCVLYIDGGTTRTRAWAVSGERVVAAETVTVGARDSAREGSAIPLRDAVRQLTVRVGERCRSQGHPEPTLAVAAGMITSGQGLVEVPHVAAPAGTAELARGAVRRGAADFGLPVVFVPGVLSGPRTVASSQIGTTDIMRGEEVLGLGLVERGHLKGGGCLVCLGSHWKALHLDSEGRVAGSVSTLGGELVAATGSHTILSSSLPRKWPADLEPEWVEEGARTARRDGLPRALYCVRLLEQRSPSSPEERLAFLVGAVVAASEEVLLPRDDGIAAPVVLVGSAPVRRAWVRVARRHGLEPVGLHEAERDEAFRAGCRAVLADVPD